MIRVAAWTGGLFLLGWGICHLFPGPLVEPLVLMALGVTLFLVSGRAVSAPRGVDAGQGPDAVTGTTRAAR